MRVAGGDGFWVARADGGEGARRDAVELAVGVVSPAGECPVRPDRAAVEISGANGGEGARRHTVELPVVVISPTREGAIVAKTACVVAARCDCRASERVGGGAGLAVAVGAPADG